MNNKVTTVVVIVILVLGVGWLYLRAPGTPPKPAPPDTSQEAAKALKQTVIGTVGNIIDSTVYFTAGAESKRVVLSADAKITKQVKAKTKDGAIQLVDVKISDIKKGNVIVVYYDTVSASGLEYTSSKIQIISDK